MRAGASSPPASPKAPDLEVGDLASLRRAILTWYLHQGRSFPWRRPPGEQADPYAVWVSEIMLQQTQAATVLPYYQRWMARLPSLADLAAAPLDTVLELWQGLGYYGRARRLWQAARQLRAEGSEVPDRFEELRALPGVGDYTAAAILSIAFGQARPAIDGNLRRVLGRIGALEGDLTRGVGARRLRELAQALVAPGESAAMSDSVATPGDLNQALMDLGALVCRPVKPDCPACPAEAFCRARALGRTADFPAPVAKAAPRPARGFAYAIQDAAGRWLVGRRTPEGLLGGLWELPWVMTSAADASAAQEAGASREPSGAPVSATRSSDSAAVGRSADLPPPRPRGLEALGPLAGPPLRHTFTHLQLELRLLRGRTLARPALDGDALPSEAATLSEQPSSGYSGHAVSPSLSRFGGEDRGEGAGQGLGMDHAPTATDLLLDLNRLSSESYETWRWVSADELAALPRSRLMDKLWRRVTEA